MNRKQRRALPKLNNTPTSTGNVQLVFTKAVQCHQAGKFEEAEPLYQQYLKAVPGHAEAHHFLGILYHQRGMNAQAVEPMQKAIALKGTVATFHVNLANVLLALGRHEEAEAICRQAIVVEPSNAGAFFALGLALKSLGRPEQAEAAYRQAIALKEDYHQAHCNLGALLKEMGQLEESEQAYRRAIQSKPDFAEAHFNLANGLRETGRLEEAEAAYRQAIALTPNFAPAHGNLGNALQALKRLDEAAAEYRQAILLQPNFAEAHSNLGSVLHEQGKLEEAEASCRRAIEITPNQVNSFFNLGSILKKKEAWGEALAAFRQALALQPNHSESALGLGLVLWDLEQFEEAEAVYRQALALTPEDDGLWLELGNTLLKQKRPEEAEACFHQSIALAPEEVAGYLSLGNALMDQERLEEAEAAYRHAATLKPDQAEAYCNLANVMIERDLCDEGESLLRQAISLQSDFALAHTNLGMLLLREEQFEEGWREYESRWFSKGYTGGKLRHTNYPQWDGRAGTGGTILLWSEQGIGDSIQFIRYVEIVQQLGWKVIVEVPESIKPLFRSIKGLHMVEAGDFVPVLEAQCPLLSVPFALGTTLETLPATIPYLFAEPERVAAWQKRLSTTSGPKIGLVWRGNSKHGRDRYRSMTADSFAPFCRIPGLTFVSLQKDARADELASLDPSGDRVLNAGPDLHDLTDTAALIATLDLVISIDSAVCHLAGALGAQTWTLLDSVPDWRWLNEREDSPWYPTMRLFRQKRRMDWPEVCQRVEAELRTLAAAS